MSHEHYFICPHCGNRSMGTDRNAGFRREARGCEKCGFAYLFELLDDYYPAPNAAFFACDADGRIVDCGRGSFELTGLKTEQAIGRPVGEVLGLRFDDGTDHVGTALEWEVRVRASRSRSTPSATSRPGRWPTSSRPTTTRRAGCWSCSRPPTVGETRSHRTSAGQPSTSSIQQTDD